MGVGEVVMGMGVGVGEVVVVEGEVVHYSSA